jgi:replicative superfamily II helicase
LSSQQSVAPKRNPVPQKENKTMMRKVRLVMIDEVHLLNERGRGAVLEALVSRMKTVQKAGTLPTKTTAA